jgi:diguanylate cyclase (GGDEF)-like protein
LLDRVRTAQGELAYQARHDLPTGLANRALFTQLLAASVAAARRDRRCLALLYCNLDDVTVVNDGLGHAAGDHLVRVAAQRLRHGTRTTDVVARLGGDEFAVILHGEGHREPTAVGERLLAAFGQPTTIAGHRRPVRASVGLVVADGTEPDSPDLLLRRARTAMHEAKRTGKNKLVVYRPGMSPAADHHLAGALATALATALRHGADSSGFDVHYQPIVSLGDGALVAVEALARWTEPGRGPVPPGEFVAVAEVGGLVAALDDLVLTWACRDVSRAFPAGSRVRLHVNVSATRLSDPGLLDSVAAALAGSGLDPCRLVVEITETGRIVDLDLAADVLGRIRRLGVAIALDDVGAGFSTIAALHRLPVDVVKLDRTLIARPMDGSRGAALRRSMIYVAHALGAVVVAEGIEHQRQIAELALLGCELGQGYLFARPAPLAELATGGATAPGWWPVAPMTVARPA